MCKRRGSEPGDVLLEDIDIREVEVVVAGTSGVSSPGDSEGGRKSTGLGQPVPYLA